MVISKTTSKWIVQHTQQVNRQIQIFLLISLSRTHSGPAKSTAANIKAGAPLTLKSGRGGCRGARIGLPSNRLQTTPSSHYPKLRLDFSQRFPYSVVANSNVYIPDYQGSVVVSSIQKNGMYCRVRKVSILYPSTTSPQQSTA